MRQTRFTAAFGSTTDDRGVTEVLSFVLVFSIVLTSVILVGLVGFQAIEDYQENEKLGNAERAMDAFADNANDVVRNDGVTHRSGTLTLREGTVSPGEAGTTLDATVYDEHGSPTWNWSDEYAGEDLGAFVYETDSMTVAYEGGGVFRGSGDGSSAVISDPMVTCRERTDTALVSLVKISHGDRSIQSTEGMEFRLSKVDGETVRKFETGTENVTVEVEDGPHRGGWETYFENAEGWEWDETENAAVCDADSVSIDVVEVQIDYPELG
ncbi:DUF7289 family protein [Natrarchaeobius oligotrophus]|uniref:Uncharacterized protein n=1 Tax=Natrarchaeobius chitinivorans TaxID=1679083 RepID=A0A3N6MAW9_NATCH|nr:hypothetical protein [Natrarchaeobius chitinivorans]RQG99677.1 hypothetical protein EA472_13555 [Natrarchaeobius chitinivorans]